MNHNLHPSKTILTHKIKVSSKYNVCSTENNLRCSTVQKNLTEYMLSPRYILSSRSIWDKCVFWRNLKEDTEVGAWIANCFALYFWSISRDLPENLKRRSGHKKWLYIDIERSQAIQGFKKISKEILKTILKLIGKSLNGSKGQCNVVYRFTCMCL